MITIGNVIEVCKIVSEASSKLTLLIGQKVDLTVVTPEIPGITNNKQLSSKLEREILINSIVDVVCSQFMIDVAALRGGVKRHPLPDARKITAYLLHTHIYEITDGEVATIINIDRSSVHYNRSQCEELIGTDKAFRFHYNRILTNLKLTIQYHD